MTIIGTPVTPSPSDPPASYTKRDFILEAFKELRLAGYEYDLSPEMMESALKRLDSMMARWYDTYGLDVGYPLPIPTTTDLDDTTDVAYGDNDAIVLNLAIAIAPRNGKNVMSQTAILAGTSLRALLTKYATTPTKAVDYTMVPAGAGYKAPSTGNGNAFLPQEEE